jgi:hypothetical protein
MLNFIPFNSFYIECLPKEDCPEPEPLLDLLPGEEEVVNNDGCCPRLERKCNKKRCPIIFPCPEFHEIVNVNGTEHLCCPAKTCGK